MLFSSYCSITLCFPQFSIFLTIIFSQCSFCCILFYYYYFFLYNTNTSLFFTHENVGGGEVELGYEWLNEMKQYLNNKTKGKKYTVNIQTIFDLVKEKQEKDKKIYHTLYFLLLLYKFCLFIFFVENIKKMNIHISHAHNLIFQKFLQIYVVYGEYINNRSIQHTYPHTTIRTKSLLMQSVLIFTKVFIQSSWDFDMSYNSNNINNNKTYLHSQHIKKCE